MNLVDVLLVLAIIGAVSTGYRFGFAARVLAWAGALIGLGMAVVIAPQVLRSMAQGASAMSRLLIGLGIVLGLTSILSYVGEYVGLKARRVVHATAFGSIDRVAGGFAGGLSVLVFVWLLTPAAAAVPGEIARQVRQSQIVGTVMALAPDPPDTARALGQLVDRSGFPEVFSDFGPAPEVGPPPEQIPVDQAIVAAATESSVNVEAFGCGSGFEGSGFVVADGLVVTNAHVVAGADEIQLRRPDGQVMAAQVHHVDDDVDLALLAAPDIGRPPLPLRPSEVGEGGAVIGYPGGQDTPRIAPATVQDDREAVGRDIYGRDRVARRILYLSANLRQGDSGSAVIGGDGSVVGVVFAVSPDDPNTAFALHIEELRAVLEATPNQNPGPCI
jgi:S1-C subfamily serine protease